MGTDCQDPPTYNLLEDEKLEFTIEYIENIEVFCRCCFQYIKTKTAYYLQNQHPIGNAEVDNSWYCHKCFKALKNAHKK